MHESNGVAIAHGHQTSPGAASERLPEEVEGVLYQHLMTRLDDIDDPRDLCDSTYDMIEALLRRPEDRPLLRTLSELVGDIISRIPFDGSPSQIRGGVKVAAGHCRVLLQAARKNRDQSTVSPFPLPALPPIPAAADEEPRDVEYWLPPHLEHLLRRVEYVAPTLPPPSSGFSNFDELCQAAILEQVDRILIFFQRHNSAIPAEIPPLYLFSPEFAAKLKPAIVKFVYPLIRNSRQVRVLANDVDLSRTDTEVFWQRVSKPLKDKLLAVWSGTWDQMKTIEIKRADGLPITQIGTGLKELRECLEPSTPQVYDLPQIRNHEIDVIKSLLDPEIDWWNRLSTEWQRCQDLYEQEKDPRIFQQQAREGAFRDSLLAAFERFPSQWADFLALSCHRVFPRINTAFLESFSMNFGRDATQRAAHLPYLMRYLEAAREHPTLKARERAEEEKWKEQTLALRAYLKGNSDAKTPTD